MSLTSFQTNRYTDNMKVPGIEPRTSGNLSRNSYYSLYHRQQAENRNHSFNALALSRRSLLSRSANWRMKPSLGRMSRLVRTFFSDSAADRPSLIIRLNGRWTPCSSTLLELVSTALNQTTHWTESLNTAAFSTFNLNPCHHLTQESPLHTPKEYPTSLPPSTGTSFNGILQSYWCSKKCGFTLCVLRWCHFEYHQSSTWIQVAFINAPHSRHKATPAELMMGHMLLSPINVKWQPSTRKVLRKLSDAFRQLKRSHEKVARKFNVGRHVMPFKIVDRVVYQIHYLSDTARGIAGKLRYRWSSPVTIHRFTSDSQSNYMGRNATLSVGNNFSTGNGPVLPKQAQVVICGAGMVANSVAYHLVQNGWTDVLVLEKEKIGSGTSHFGSGTLGLFKPIPDRQLIMYSIKLYRKLQELGYDIDLLYIILSHHVIEEGTSLHEGTGDHGVLGVVLTAALLSKTSLHEGTGAYGVLDVVLTIVPPRKILSNFLSIEATILSSAGNAMYVSPIVQNELVHLIGEQIQTAILDRIKISIFFTILAEETTDISRVEQFSFCVRYFDVEIMDIREDFFTFISVYDMTGAGIADTIKLQISRFGLDLQNVRGQGYDGASVMHLLINLKLIVTQPGEKGVVGMGCVHTTYSWIKVFGSDEMKRLHPYLRTEDLEGAIWVPEDARTNRQREHTAAGLDNKLPFASFFSDRARFVENCEVEQVLTENSHIKAVSTSSGTVLCEYFVNCAGMWARGLGLRCSPTVRIPALPAEHFYVTTPPMADLDPWLPCVRDYDSHTYAREWEGGFMVGGFEKEAKPAFNGGDVPVDWKNNLPQDWKHFMPLWEKAIHRFPVLKDIGSATLSNSPDNFTPDGRWILGETPEVTNYFVAVGMNGNSLQAYKGGCKQHTRHYSILYPLQSEYKYARKLRCSPLYSVLETRGAVFGTRMGYERPLYFDSTYKPGNPLPQMPPGSFYKPRFFDFMLEEYLACREGVGIIDMSSFSKMQIKSSGTEVVDYLQKLCSNDVNIPVGGCAHTGMQNERGGYENDCMLVRLTNNSYFMVSPTSQQTRIFEWMHQNLPSDSTVDITDMTSMYTVINVVGPKSRELMAELSNSDINLHPFTYKKVNVGYASDVMVMSFTHTGEPGYCLYIPSEYALHVYDRLMMVGRDFGARDVGSLTQRFMRIERFMPFWAEELTSVTTPFEAGHGHRVKLDKEYFIGKFALQRQKDQGVTKRLVFFHLEDVDPNQHVWPWGGEPIYRNNECVGHVTSAGYGFTLSKLVCLGFIRHPGRNKGTRQIITEEFIMARNAKYELDIAGSRVVVKPHIHAPYFATANIDNSKKKYRPTVVNIKSPENIRLPYTA
uniref:Pyruvate dehydrogenase phosphatase regulatory subunit, mitochondrial n=1 Tax=Timema poppense TaxID=170557 RepID=A0A7R9CVU2_TIMPO|nr:unnamed protein product [Timema poppensis]